jgi:hypothetical protein
LPIPGDAGRLKKGAFAPNEALQPDKGLLSYVRQGILQDSSACLQTLKKEGSGKQEHPRLSRQAAALSH